MSEFTILHQNQDRRRHWTSRDVVSLFLAVAMFVLATLAWQMWRTQQGQSRDLQALSKQLSVKDARIRQLTNALIRAHIPVPPNATPSPSPSPGVSPTPSPTSRKTQDPSPSPAPRPSRSPTASPSPSCLLPLSVRCVTPPSFRLLPALLF